MLRAWIAPAPHEICRTTEIYVSLPERCPRTPFFSAPVHAYETCGMTCSPMIWMARRICS
jgi:hypothetical protein